MYLARACAHPPVARCPWPVICYLLSVIRLKLMKRSAGEPAGPGLAKRALAGQRHSPVALAGCVPAGHWPGAGAAGRRRPPPAAARPPLI